MTPAEDQDRVWHENVISSETERCLRALQKKGILGDFYLAGGTALALQFGHRISNDLDFFSPVHFDQDALLQRVQELEKFALVQIAPFTLHATISGTKVTFLGYAYPTLFPPATFLDVAIADPRDIACMKMSAIASRGAKRDFLDLYVSIQRYGLREILLFFDRKYAGTRVNRLHVLKSLTYFADAEKDPMPRMLQILDWEKVKQYFAREVPSLL